MHSPDNNSMKCYNPKSIVELDQLISKVEDKIDFIAGATDMLVQDEKWQNANNLVDLSSVDEINNKIELENDNILIGAAVPLSHIISSEIIQKKLPILVKSCKLIGSVQIQNRATLGGNIANASPAGDSLPVLSVLNSQLWIGPEKNGEFEKLTLNQVMTGPGMTSLKNNRYIAFINIPIPRENSQFWYFRKVGQRESMAISKVSLAVFGWFKNNKIEKIRICPGSVTAQINRANKTEELLKGKHLSESMIEQAYQSIMTEVSPINDIRSTADYRRKITGEILREALHSIF